MANPTLLTDAHDVLLVFHGPGRYGSTPLLYRRGNVMRTSRALLVATAGCLFSAVVPAAFAGEDLPVAVAIVTPVDAGLLLATATATCSTTAIPPQSTDVLDPLHVTGRLQVDCNDQAYPAQGTVELRYYGARGTGPGTRVGVPETRTNVTPLTVTTQVARFGIPEGWYRTVGQSWVTYPSPLDTRKRPGSGCGYVSSTVVTCTATSSAVYITQVEPIMGGVLNAGAAWGGVEP
jgi:hypothetical protein